MNRYVCKGRGQNRGKYLRECYDHAERKQVVTWEEKQSRGSRYTPDSPGSHQTMRLAALNGYLVKLVVPKAITPSVVREIKAYIEDHAAGAVEPKPCYWFSASFHDTYEGFCWDCAVKLVDQKYEADPSAFRILYGRCDTPKERHRAAIDGGFETRRDSPPRCTTCDAKLSGYLTNTGADQEIDELTDDCAPAPEDVEGWDALSTAVLNLLDNDPRWRRIARVVDAARAAEQGASR